MMHGKEHMMPEMPPKGMEKKHGKDMGKKEMKMKAVKKMLGKKK